VIGVVAFATGAVPGFDEADDTPLGIAQPSASEGPSAPSSGTPSSGSPSSTTTTDHATTSPATGVYAVYYVGTDPRGRPVLFREFHRGPDLPTVDPAAGDDVLTEAVRDAMTHPPLDPDYVSPWAGLATLDSASYETTGAGDTLRVALGAGAPRDRPVDMSAAEAEAAVQQLVYTAQAAVGKRVPVTFTIGRHTPPARTLLGVDISHEVPAGPPLRTLSLVSISDPANGDVVSGKLKVTGVNNAFEGTVVVSLERNGKQRLVVPGIGGMGGNRLWPWEVTLDLSQVEPGTYRLVARNDDPSGRGKAPVDDRVVVVR